MKIISGGQTGADQAALDAAIHLGLPHGGCLPRGRKTENGPLPQTYRLRELHSPRYRDRTEQNVLDSDATLIVSRGPLKGGSALTEALAIRHGRPCLHLDLTHSTLSEAVSRTRSWLEGNRVETLNVAGPRASTAPDIHGLVFALLVAVLQAPLNQQKGSP